MSETSNVLYIKFENHKVPEFKEVKNKEYIYFGEDNNYPDYLIELYLRCAKHNAIINGKTNYIYGGGLVTDDKTSTVNQKAITQKFISKLKPFINDMIKDFELFNSIAIEIIYDKLGNEIADFAYMPISKIRTNADESVYFYSNDWKQSKQTEEKTGFKELAPFDYENKVKGSQLFVFKLKSPKNGVDKNVYGIPNYIGATSAIETDIEISNFHLNNIKSGFSMGQIISFNNGVPPTEEAKKQIERQIKQKATGTDKAGGLVITFNASQDNAPTIQSFSPNDLDKQFIEIGKRVDQEIFTSHNIVSPVLFGVSTQGALGQRNEMLDAYELFQSTYISIRQGILEDIINEFSSYFGIANYIYFAKSTPLKSSIPESLIQQAYTPQEVRELLGLKPLTQDKTQAGQAVIDAINTLSPLVANKVLESMTADEIRGLVGLMPTSKQPSLFSAEKKKCEHQWFDNIGIKASDCTILYERDYEGQSDEDCIETFKKEKFAEELLTNEKAIIDLLSKDVLTPSESIAKVLKISTAEVNDIITSLVERGYLSSGSEPTKKGEKASEDSKTDNIEVKYRYGWRAGFDATDKKNSRDFCVDLLNKDKLYSRSEIETLNNEQGLDVWESRGGWWNKGGVSVPFCRHLWKQVVIKTN